MKLLSMSGFIPEYICDTVRFTGYSGESNISHFCGYANDFITQVINDDDIDGAVYPKSCDSTRVIGSYIAETNKFSFQLNVPARTDELAVDFFAKELEQYKKSIEQHYGVIISDIPDRIKQINKRNRTIGKYYDQIGNYLYSDYIEQIHQILSNPVMSETDMNLAVRKSNGKRVFILGSFLSNTNIAKKIEEKGFCIVGDNLPESGRIANSTIDSLEEGVFKAIARNILARKLSPTQSNFSDLINRDLIEINDRHAQAVIFITQKYCEPYDYLYSVYKKKLDEKGIPLLKITVTDSQDDRKVDLMLEAFAGTL